jgi:uncharacterized membrane protein
MSDADGPGPPEADGGRPGDPPDSGDLMDSLEALEAQADSGEEVRLIREAMDLVEEVDRPGAFGRVIVGFDRGDAAEALLGSIVFGLPMLVEGGTQEVGSFLATHPAYHLGTLAATVGLVVGILYVAEIQDVRVRDPLLGFVPRRLVGVLSIAFAVALGSMTLWGRVDWSTPEVAFAQVTVAFTAMAIGASLGDILPGT